MSSIGSPGSLGSTLLLLRIIIGRRRCVVISGSGRSLRWVLRLRLGKEGFEVFEWVGGRGRPPGWLADSGCSVVSVHSAVLELHEFYPEVTS